MFLTGIMPFACFFFLFLHQVRRNNSISDAFVKSYLIIWLAICVSTELFSLVHQLTRTAVLCFWLICLVVSAFLCRHEVRGGLARISDIFRQIPFTGVSSLLLLAGIFCCGAVYQPNNFDSMTYHLGRVAMWIQNMGVQFFDTCISRQNYQMPLAEYGILHLSLLSGCDRMAFLIQWTALIASVAGCVRITGLLGGSRQAQWNTCFFCITIPMALAQASSTQNDLVVSSFLVIFVRFLLDFSPKTIFWTGFSFGLALMTKGTAYIYAPILGLGLGIFRLVSAAALDRKRIFLSLCATVMLGMMLSTGFYCRNLYYYHSPIYSPPEHNYMIRKVSPVVMAAGIVKHISIHTAVPIRKINDFTDRLIHRMFPNTVDRKGTNFSDQEFRVSFGIYEDTVGNFLHFSLYVISLIFLFSVKYDGVKRVYAGTVIAAALLFFSVMTWNSWQSRLHTPVFILFTPIPAILLERFSSLLIHRCVEFSFFSFAIVALLYIEPRPMKKIFSDYDNVPLERRTACKAICRALPEYRPLHVGIVCGGDHRVYFLFREMNIHARFNPDLRIDFDPAAPVLICDRQTPVPNESAYSLVCEHPPYRLLVKRKNGQMPSR